MNIINRAKKISLIVDNILYWTNNIKKILLTVNIISAKKSGKKIKTKSFITNILKIYSLILNLIIVPILYDIIKYCSSLKVKKNICLYYKEINIYTSDLVYNRILNSIVAFDVPYCKSNSKCKLKKYLL